MKRLYLTVEGQTESAFAMDVLQPHLLPFGVYLYRPRFTGLHRRGHGRIPQGGLLGTFGHALNDIRRWLKEDRSSDARFSMMVDLYSLPQDFPGYVAGMRERPGAAQATALEQSLATAIGDPRFIPHLQVHEYEALVPVDPEHLATLYEVASSVLNSLCRECGEYATPEDINHGQHSHPKFRIKERVPDYDENIAGPLLAGTIGLPTLRQRCPHFGVWLSRLEQLDDPGM